MMFIMPEGRKKQIKHQIYIYMMPLYCFHNSISWKDIQQAETLIWFTFAVQDIKSKS